jgi:hypothetical protein
MRHDEEAQKRGAAMTHGFQQQDTALGFSIPKSAATPQHGQKAVAKPSEPKEPRSFKPRPGH